ncbi:MAG: YckD family protein [Thermomicrobiales bacterium]|nr:YckD family protein [Thermomicrobiales bacterium]
MGEQHTSIDPQERHTPTRRRWLAVVLGLMMIGALVVGGTVAAEEGSSDSNSGLGESFLNRLADNLGISRDSLNDAITTAGNETVDEAVTNGDLTESQGDALKNRIENGHFFSFGRPGARIGMAVFGHGVTLDTVSDTLGMSVDDLTAELQSGSTLEEIITAHGSSVDAIVNALVEQAKSSLDTAVANGRLTQAQADNMLSALPERLTQMIENGFGGDCGPRDGGRMPGSDNATPDAEQEASPTA